MNPHSPNTQRVRKLKDRFREQTSSAIVAAAEEVLAEQGLHGGSMGEIAKRAGVAVGTLYNHFADREALLRHLLDTRCRELVEQLDQDLKQFQRGNFVDQLMALVNNFLSAKETHRALFVIVMQQGQ